MKEPTTMALSNAGIVAFPIVFSVFKDWAFLFCISLGGKIRSSTYFRNKPVSYIFTTS